MKLRLKLILYLVFIHLVFAVTAYFVFLENRVWLFALEGFFILSFVAGLTLIRSMFKPLELIATGSELIQEGDFTSKMRESLVSIGRMSAYMTATLDNMKQVKEMKDHRARVKILQRDIASLTDHSSFLSGKINFLLDAVLGLINIEQAGIIKIFSVAAVVFLPPTLVASTESAGEFRSTTVLASA